MRRRAVSRRHLGVCYYPEHWPEAWWAEDARRMAEAGIRFVRIGEFAWSRLEPARGRFDFAWLGRAIDTLGAAGLRVVLGTPTATPPKWLVDEMPDMLPIGADGRVRGFGSRRHYDFSHEGYRQECARIVTALAERFGRHEAVAAWQTDNEYGCHDTTLSYSAAALRRFRDWLARRYQSPDALNRAWGNVFWSMEYGSFEEIELPNQTVTEANPAHRMDFRRFASEEVAGFNRLQVDILRRLSPGRDIIHNFMGRTLAFDHFAVGADLDVSSWDSYPLGFLEDRVDETDAWKRAFARAGDPDFQAFHHDIYRATSAGRWWVMEQQPGPVNWAPRNPIPRAGMVRLWAWEAFAHGAEVVSFFRWRQAPFAQEQMHAGLLRPDSVPAAGCLEAVETARELAAIDLPQRGEAPVGIVFDYASAWAWEIQPQGREFDYFRLVFELYRAVRRLGLDVDILPPGVRSFGSRRLVLVPGLFAWTGALREAVAAFRGMLLVGPRSGSKTDAFSIPAGLPPDLPAALLPVTVARVESLRPDLIVPAGAGAFRFWREEVEGRAEVLLRAADGLPALLRHGSRHYLAGWPDPALAAEILGGLARAAGLATLALPAGVRVSRCGALAVALNYGETDADLAALGLAGTPLLGTAVIPPSGVTVLRQG
jgi:beta-galactosidase